MQLELRQREEMRGPAADGLLLGLWIGEVFGAIEYWLLRAASLAVDVTRRFLAKPVLVATLAASAMVGAFTARDFAGAGDARARRALLDLKAIQNGVLLFRTEHAAWPNRLEELVPRYLGDLHGDPWGHNYVLFRGEGGIAIVSAGGDGQLGTSDDVIVVGK
jgi:hypothetical protein